MLVLSVGENTFGDEGHPDFNLDLKLSQVFLNKRVNYESVWKKLGPKNIHSNSVVRAQEL